MARAVKSSFGAGAPLEDLMVTSRLVNLAR
jgi:hypothetical protein